MFTGLIQDIGTVKRIAGSRIEVRTALAGLASGGSIAVNGACLTIAALTQGAFSAKVSPETLRATMLGQLVSGSRVNLEQPVGPDRLFHGHIVQGHVDGTVAVRQVRRQKGFVEYVFELPAPWRPYIVDKGSVAIDGVSLTVAQARQSSFVVWLIPETLSKTVLGGRRPGDRVNIETDIIAKYLRAQAANSRSPGRVTKETLSQEGFI